MITHFIASLVSGFFSTLVSIPVDITKTRLQNMKVIDGKPQYKGTIDCLVKTVKYEPNTNFQNLMKELGLT